MSRLAIRHRFFARSSQTSLDAGIIRLLGIIVSTSAQWSFVNFAIYRKAPFGAANSFDDSYELRCCFVLLKIYLNSHIDTRQYFDTNNHKLLGNIAPSTSTCYLRQQHDILFIQCDNGCIKSINICFPMFHFSEKLSLFLFPEMFCGVS